MKKILLIFLLLTVSIIAKWEAVEELNDFNEPTGKIDLIRNVDNNEKNIMAFNVIDKNSKFFFFGQIPNYLLSTRIGIKLTMKNENNELLNLHGVLYENGMYATVIFNDSPYSEEEKINESERIVTDKKTLINYFERSKKVKVLITEILDDVEYKNLAEYDTSNFKEYSKLIKGGF